MESCRNGEMSDFQGVPSAGCRTSKRELPFLAGRSDNRYGNFAMGSSGRRPRAIPGVGPAQRRPACGSRARISRRIWLTMLESA